MRFLLVALALMVVRGTLPALTAEEHRIVHGGASVDYYVISAEGGEALKTFKNDCVGGRQAEAIAWLKGLSPGWTPTGPNPDLGLLLAAPRSMGPQNRPVLRALLSRILATPAPTWDVRQEWINQQYQAVRSLVWGWDRDFAGLSREERRAHAQEDVRLLQPWLLDVLGNRLTCDEITRRTLEGDWRDPNFPSGLDPANPDRTDPRYLVWRDDVIRVHSQRGPAWHRAEAWERLGPDLITVIRHGWPRLEGGRAALTAELVKARYPRPTIAVVADDIKDIRILRSNMRMSFIEASTSNGRSRAAKRERPREVAQLFQGAKSTALRCGAVNLSRCPLGGLCLGRLSVHRSPV